MRLGWEDVLDTGPDVEQEQALAVDACDGRVVTTGYSGSVSGVRKTRFIVRAYDAASGSLEWQDDYEEPDVLAFGSTLDCDGGRVFVGRDLERAQTLRGYAAADGSLLWEQDISGAGWGRVLSVVARDEVVVSLVSTETQSASEFVVRAFDASDGDLRWEYVAQGAEFGGYGRMSLSDATACMLLRDQKVSGEFSITCLNLDTGDFSWDDVLGHSGEFVAPAFSADGETVLAASADDRFGFVRAYDAQTGAEKWEREYPPDMSPIRGTVVTDLSALGDTFFIAASDFNGAPPVQVDFLVEAIDQAGTVLWQDRHPLGESGFSGDTNALVHATSEVVALAESGWRLRLYGTEDGSLIAESMTDFEAGAQLHGLANDGDRFFLAGTLAGSQEALDWDFAVRTFRARLRR